MTKLSVKPRGDNDTKCAITYYCHRKRSVAVQLIVKLFHFVFSGLPRSLRSLATTVEYNGALITVVTPWRIGPHANVICVGDGDHGAQVIVNIAALLFLDCDSAIKKARNTGEKQVAYATRKNKLELCRCAVVGKRSVQMIHERANNKQMRNYNLFCSFYIFQRFSIYHDFLAGIYEQGHLNTHTVVQNGRLAATG